MASAKGAKSKKRTATQAIQTDQADIAGYQKQKGQRTKQFQKEAGSYRGATDMSIAQIQAQNLGGLRGTPEGKQLQQEYKSRIQDLRTSLPFTLAPVQREYKSDIQGINQDLASAQLGLQQDQQDRLAAIAEIQATRKQNAAEEAAKIGEQKAEKKSDVDTAYREALRLIRGQDLRNKDPNVDEKDKGHPIPTSEAEWTDFFEALRSTAGVTDRGAVKAIKALHRRLGHVPTSRHPQSKFESRFQLPLG